MILSDADWITPEDVFSFDEYLSKTADGDSVVLFTAPTWCQPCVQFEQHWNRAIKENTRDVKFLRVHLDHNEWAMVELGIRSVPTIYLMRDGAVVNTPPVRSAMVLFKAMDDTF